MIGDMSRVTARQPCTHCVPARIACVQGSPVRRHNMLQNEGRSIWKFYKDFLLNDDFYQKFLLCVSRYGEDLYSHQKLDMYIKWFSSESGYRHRRRWRQRRTPQYKY